MNKKAINTVEKYNMLSKGDRVLVAVIEHLMVTLAAQCTILRDPESAAGSRDVVHDALQLLSVPGDIFHVISHAAKDTLIQIPLLNDLPGGGIKLPRSRLFRHLHHPVCLLC